VNSSVGFVGRARQLARLSSHLEWVESGGADQRGRCVLLRGRRRVGKSRLVEVFCGQSNLPVFWFSCTHGEDPAQERAQFVSELSASSLLNAAVVGDDVPGSWHVAFRRLADALSDDQPAIVVIDEIPWLTQQDPAAEGALQTVWDRYLSRKPVLLVLVGSDLAMMEHLSSYGRPFHQRAIEMVLDPLDPADVADMLRLSAADAFDAYVITGGLPLICQEWPKKMAWRRYLNEAFADPTSALIVSGERIMAAEFPSASRARDVLEVIGDGERTFSRIAGRLGGAQPLAPGTLNGALTTLLDKRVIAVGEPLSLRPAPKERRYRVDDPFLRFWLRFVAPALPAIERGRGDLALRAVDDGWMAWRGRAIEPIVRHALGQLMPNDDFPDAGVVGGWWNRQNNPEVDLVAVDNAVNPQTLAFVGSIKWRDKAPFDRSDLADLARVAALVPGADSRTPLVAVSRSGFTVTDLAATFTPDTLLAASRRTPPDAP
jgi:uncharacterized protein